MTTLHLRTPAGARTLSPGDTVRIGRDRSADVTIQHPDVSRHHAVLYFADGWCIADEGSLNGTHLDGVRVEAARLERSTEIVLGRVGSGVTISVELPTVTPAVSRTWMPAEEASMDVLMPMPDLSATVLSGPSAQPFRGHSAVSPLPAGTRAITIGKAPDNDIVVGDVHASRHHARAVIVPGGLLIEDLNSLNGTFVNAAPIQRAFLADGDTLTIGNSDFVREGDTLVRAAAGVAGGLVVTDLTFAIRGGKKLIDGVSVSAKRGTLTAVIGPSGAGKSTLSRLLAGVSEPTSGRVEFDGFDLQRDYQAVKTRVGLVPQDDVVHRQLSVQRALSYAASLRLASGLTGKERARQVGRATSQLGLEKHLSTRIDKLSGGQRKRASVALELLTEPSLLILDEPTSGLDPALDRQVMATLRDLADGERTVLVITHSVAYLDMCDQIIVLAPGGLPAYIGPPSGVTAHFGTDDWGDIFGVLAADPVGSRDRWESASRGSARRPSVATVAAKGHAGRGSSWARQLVTLMARQVNLMVADRGYIVFLLALPFVVGLLPLVVPGDAGLTAVPSDQPKYAGEPTSVLALLIIGSTFMGISMSIRDLVGERAIYLRERAVGLYPSSYLFAKLLVYGVFSAISAAIMTAVAVWVKAPPDSGVLGLDSPVFELFLPLALTTWVGAALGLAISAFVSSNDQVMPVLIVALMVQLVLHGGLIPVLDNDVLNALSRAVPGRWGFAAAASGIDLETLTAPGQPAGVEVEHDPLWESTKLVWFTNMAALAAFGALFSTATWLRLRGSRR